MVVFRIILAWLCLTGLHAQISIAETLERFNKGTIPYITSSELNSTENQLLLDTRSWKEYQVSHMKNAFWVGYEKFDSDRILKAVPNKQTPLVVYCSVGVRSEDIGEKLIILGYTNVKNLYGGIFEWKNQGYPVFDSSGKKTSKVHAYSKHWGKLLTNAEKVF